MEPLQYEERGYLKEPFRLFHLADGRGEYIEYHYHAFHKIIILLAGKAGYAVEGERYELSPGDFVSPFDVHDITGPNKGKTLCYR